jgi:hypothetical protein
MEHGGYMAIYRAEHEIHCLDWIKRQWTVYKDERPELVEHLGKIIFTILSFFPSVSEFLA